MGDESGPNMSDDDTRRLWWTQVTVERRYCHAPLVEDDDRFLMRETYEFGRDHNPLFLARPEWLRLATCFSAYGS